MTEKTLAIPTIHLNGTSAASLLREYGEATRALATAIQRVKATAPHGRDYYPQGDKVIDAAVAQHSARVAALQNVFDELCEIYEAVSNGGHRGR